MVQLGTSRRGGISRRWLALGALILGVICIGLDATVLNLALPTLSGSLHASEAELQWFVTAYTLALAASMMPAGLLGDRYGRKTVMLAGLALVGVASLVCAYSPNPTAFIAARAALGMAGAALVVMSLSVVMVLFAEDERPRAMGVWAAGNFLAMPLGPIVGGWILAHAWWGWVFLMNVPVAVVGFVAVVGLVPQSRTEPRPGIDVPGIVTSSAGLALIMYGLVQVGDYGWGSSDAIAPSLLGVLSLILFVAWEAWLIRRPGGEPLIDLGLFRSRNFNAGMILAAAGIFGMFGVLFTLPQYLQAIAGIDAQGAGLRFLPTIGGMVVGAVPADRIAARLGPKLAVALGFAVLAAGMFAGATMSTGSSDGFIAAWTFVVGAGAGLGLATAASVAVVELPANRSGVGSALLQAVIKLGPAFGATILGSVLSSSYQGRLNLTGLPSDAANAVERSVFGGIVVAQQLGSPTLLESVRAAFVAAMDDATRVAAVIALAGALLALAAMPRRIAASADAQHGAAPAMDADGAGAAVARSATMEL